MKGVSANPSRRGVRRGRQAARDGHSSTMQSSIALANLAQRPVHSLLHEVAIISCAPFDERQHRPELVVCRRAMVNSEAGKSRKRRAARERS